MATIRKDVWYPRAYKLYDGTNGHGWELMRQPSRRVDRFRTGVAVANWKQKIQNNISATSDMTAEYWSVPDESRVYCQNVYRINSFQPFTLNIHDGHVISYYTNFPVWSTFASSAENQAKRKFFNAIREAHVQLQGMIFLGELRETLRMLRRPAEGLHFLLDEYIKRARALKKSPRGPIKERRFDRALSKLWLEFAFGWTPLLHDIHDAIQAYNSLLEKEREIVLSVGGKDFKRVGPTAPALWNLDHSTHQSLRYSDITDYTDIVRFRGVVKATAATTARDRFARFGFTPSEFIPTAWELLPWSFLVDYFANIGEILEAIVTDTSKVIWVSKSQVRIVDLFRSGYITNAQEKVGSSNTQSYSSSPGFLHYRRRYVQRWANPGLTLPELNFRLPRFWKQHLNIVSLLDLVRRDIGDQRIRPRNYRL